MFSDDFRMNLGHFFRFLDIPDGFGMFPNDSGAFQIVFGAFRSCESPEKSDLFLFLSPTKLFVGQKVICWKSFKMDFAKVSR